MSYALDIACPACGAEEGLPCLGKRGQVRKAFHQERGRRDRGATFTAPDEVTESPIEDELVGALLDWLHHYDFRHIDFETQARVGPFRADVLVIDGDRRLAVECDGRAFHTSAEQVARDKKRDRYFASVGIGVMRFTGTEIRRDPRGCAAEIGRWIKL
jgi:very-short-patch-repair endonuclease